MSLSLGRKGKVLLSTALALVVISSLLFLSGMLPLNREAARELKRFNSYEELRAFLISHVVKGRRGFTYFSYEAKGTYKASETSPTPPRYSKTNVQVEGVDEADIVKTDGEFIYTISNRSVAIVKAYPPEEAILLSKLEPAPTADAILLGLFVNDDILVVIGEEAGYFSVMKRAKSTFVPRPHGCNTTIWIYDISDREAPELLNSVSVDGYYLTSRMIGDYVYVLSCCPAITWKDEGFDVHVPRIRSGDREEVVPPSKIYYADIPDVDYDYTIVLAIDLNAPAAPPSYEAFLTGLTTCVYVSIDNLYLAASLWASEEDETVLYRIKISGSSIVPEAQGSVPGWVLNQFSMDEHDGYFRIATTRGHVLAFRLSGQRMSDNNIYVLDMDLNIVGRLEGLAPGERIYAARFMGNRCYLVTFRKVDPLFAIDLSDPTAPKVLGKLKIPGYSDYLHPLDDEHIIGIGKETVPAEEGDFSWYQGLKIALFDVSDPEKPKLIDKLVIGDRGTDSPVLRDHKALLFDAERGIMVLPVLLAEIDKDAYGGEVPPYVEGDFVWQGALVLRVSVEDGIEVMGNITHVEDPDFFKRLGHYCPDSPYFIDRALYIGDVLYTVSDALVLMSDLWTLAELGRVYLL